MGRWRDILFGLFFLALLGLSAFHIGVLVVALVGAFACGSIYVFAGMIPSASESLGQRLFTSIFLSLVLSSLILILPGTLGIKGIDRDKQVILVIALLPPLAAIGFELLRTPHIVRRLLRWLGYD